MTRSDDFRIRPGRIRSTRAARTKPFLAQALQAAQNTGIERDRPPRRDEHGDDDHGSLRIRPAELDWMYPGRRDMPREKGEDEGSQDADRPVRRLKDLQKLLVEAWVLPSRDAAGNLSIQRS